MLIVTTAAALLFAVAPAQVPEKARGLKTNQASKRQNGSAGALLGPVVLYNLFVDDQQSSWSKEDRDRARSRMQAATDFLSLHARKYGKKIDIIQDYQDGLKLDRELPTDMFVDPGWTEAVFKLTGASSGNDLVARLKKKHKVEDVLLIIHVNKKATSYSLSYYDGIDPVYAAERVVCFFRYGDGRPSAAATYAHEILHGFGAGELYFPFDETNDRKKRGQLLFPNDVMQRVDYDLSQLNVGAYTAFRVGWLNKLPEDYKVFEDWKLWVQGERAASARRVCLMHGGLTPRRSPRTPLLQQTLITSSSWQSPGPHRASRFGKRTTGH